MGAAYATSTGIALYVIEGCVMADPKPMKLRAPFYRFDPVRRPGRKNRFTPYICTSNLSEAAELAHKKRHLSCKSYDRCLMHAARSQWQGFSCDGCGAFEHDEKWLG